MNKYQEAFCTAKHLLKKEGYFVNDLDCLKILKTPVDKETPMKPIKTRCTNKCPRCKNTLPLKENVLKKKAPKIYCDRCGQRIDLRKGK